MMSFAACRSTIKTNRFVLSCLQIALPLQNQHDDQASLTIQLPPCAIIANKMIGNISIQGFKSIRSQKVCLGAINVLIGGNGIGKTNFISAFELVRDIYDCQLQNYVMRKGGANSLLYNGSKVTSHMELDLEFDHDGYKNRFVILLEEAQDTLFVKEAKTAFWSGERWHFQLCDRNVKESTISDKRVGQTWYVGPLLEQLEIYHFHDTGDRSPMKSFCDLHDNKRLRRDGGNIAAYLYFLSKRYPKSLQRIERMVAMVSPFFDAFVLEPSKINPETIRLEWKQQGVDDMTFNAYQLSDGTLRFICLATLLMQPEPPSTLLIDEPELGLHPLAINKLCDMLKKVSAKSQIILSTQSTNVVDNFDADDIIVADMVNNASSFHRLDEDALKNWLESYSLGEIWEKNLIGGQPF